MKHDTGFPHFDLKKLWQISYLWKLIWCSNAKAVLFTLYAKNLKALDKNEFLQLGAINSCPFFLWDSKKWTFQLLITYKPWDLHFKTAVKEPVLCLLVLGLGFFCFVFLRFANNTKLAVFCVGFPKKTFHSLKLNTFKQSRYFQPGD